MYMMKIESRILGIFGISTPQEEQQEDGSLLNSDVAVVVADNTALQYGVTHGRDGTTFYSGTHRTICSGGYNPNVYGLNPFVE